MDESSRLNHALTGRDVRGQAHPHPNGNHAQINTEPGSTVFIPICLILSRGCPIVNQDETTDVPSEIVRLLEAYTALIQGPSSLISKAVPFI